MQRLGVVANLLKPRAAEVLRMVSAAAATAPLRLFGDAALQQWIPAIEPCREEDFGDHVEAVMAMGGDGTMLRTVRLLGDRALPVIGVNIGSLGFLTSVALEDVGFAVRCLAEGRYRPVDASVASCVVIRDGSELARCRAINDVVVSRGASSRVITLSVQIDHEPVTSYVCDGLIVSTPVGSTGHALSAGGPILSPETSAFVICLICPHTLSSRPLVIADRSLVEVTVSGCTMSPTLTVDGQVGITLREGDSLHITRSPIGARFIHLPGYSYYAVLRQKLSWSGSAVKGHHAQL